MTTDSTKTADATPDGTGAATPPAAAPQAPAASTATSPAERMKASLVAKGIDGNTPVPVKQTAEGEKPALESPVEKPAEGEGEGEKPPVEGEVPPEELNTLTPEDEQYIGQVLSELDSQEKLQAEVNLWSNTFHPATEAYLEQQRVARAGRLDAQNALAAAGAPQSPEVAVTPAEGATGAAGETIKDELVPLNIGRAMRSVADVNSPFDPRYITSENAADVLGIDPDKIPAKYATALSKLVETNNRATADAQYFRGEGKKAFKKRDDAQNKLFEFEAKTEMEKAGVDMSGGMELVLPEIRKMAFENGQRRPWSTVIQEATQKYPNLVKLRQASGTETTGNPGGMTPLEPTTPKPVEGTRVTNAPRQPATQRKPATTLGQASANLAQRVAEAQKKS